MGTEFLEEIKTTETTAETKEQKELSFWKQHADYTVVSTLKGLLSYRDTNESELQAIFDESKSMEDLELKMDTYFSSKSKDKDANYSGFLDRIKILKDDNAVKSYFELLKNN